MRAGASRGAYAGLARGAESMNARGYRRNRNLDMRRNRVPMVCLACGERGAALGGLRARMGADRIARPRPFTRPTTTGESVMKPTMLAFAIGVAIAFAWPSAVWAQDEWAEQAEEYVAQAEAAAKRAETAAREGDIEGARAAEEEARNAAVDAALVAHADASLREARDRAWEHVRRAQTAINAAEAQAHNEAVERASEAAERAVEDYRVIYGILEDAELAVALAERAMENAENEEDYAEAWKRHREVEQYRNSLSAIAMRAKHLAVSARDSVNRPDEALGYASEVANLRAQVEG